MHKLDVENCNSILFCTSLMQVVIARSAMSVMTQRDGKKRRIYIVIVHPALLEHNKEQIRRTGLELEYECTIDLSKNYADYLLRIKHSQKHLKGVQKLIWYGETVSDSYCKFALEVKNILQKSIGEIDEVYVRSNFKDVEKIFISTLSSRVSIYGIDDGLGDYLPRNWPYFPLNLHEIVVAVKSTVKSLARFILFYIGTGQLSLSRKLFLDSAVMLQEEFRNIRSIHNTTISEIVVRNIEKLAVNREYDQQKKIVIVGTIIVDERYGFSIDRELEIYNACIRHITETTKLANHEIWFKHHPRTSRELWEALSKGLECQCYPYLDSALIEVEFLDPGLVAVYTVGSTAMLHAKLLFNIPTYLIDLSDEKNIHPSDYKKYKYLAQRYEIPTIPPLIYQ